MKKGKTISRKLSAAYWPNPQINAGADRAAGNAAVDRLTLAQLRAFFEYCTAGPTYCLVKDHVKNFIQLVRKDKNWYHERNNILSSLRSFHSEIESAVIECNDNLRERKNDHDVDSG